MANEVFPSAAFLQARELHLRRIGRLDLIEQKKPDAAAPENLRGREYMRWLVEQESEAA
jgi:hypothetical protein